MLLAAGLISKAATTSYETPLSAQRSFHVIK